MNNIKEIYLNRPLGTREPQDISDFGDDLTVGLHLKKKAMKNFFDKDNFGVYLGDNKVGIKDNNFDIVKTIQYNSLEEMKSIWILD